MATIIQRKNKKGEIYYQAKIRMKGFPPKSASFKSKTKAVIWSNSIETAMREGRYFKTVEAKKHTLSELIDRYIQYKLPHRKSDHKKFEMQLNWWKDRLGAYLLSDIKAPLLAEFRDKLKKEPSIKDLKDGTKLEKPRSNATVNRYMAALSIALSIASREWQWLEENPMFKVTKKKEHRGRIRFLSDDEHKALILACEQASNPLINLLVVIALSTGARFSEILYLKWENVDFKRKIFYFMDTKNKEHRAVPISSRAYELLQKHSKVRKINSSYVFARLDGKKPADLRWQWEEVVKKSQLTDFRFHDLRHTAASYLAMNGATLVEISDILGHKTMQMVKRYSHLTQKHTAEVLERMNEKQFANVVEAKA